MRVQLKPESQSLGKKAALIAVHVVSAGCYACARPCNLHEVSRADLNGCNVMQSLISCCRAACLWAGDPKGIGGWPSCQVGPTRAPCQPSADRPASAGTRR